MEEHGIDEGKGGRSDKAKLGGGGLRRRWGWLGRTKPSSGELGEGGRGRLGQMRLSHMQ